MLMASPYELLLGMSLLREKKRLKNHESETSEGNSFLLTRVNDLTVLIPQSDIEEIIPATQITQMPDTKAWFKGLTSFKGSLLPLVDLSILLDAECQNTPKTNEARILVVHSAESLLGLYVHKVEGIQHYWLQKETIHADSNKLDNLLSYCQVHRMQNDDTVYVLDMKKIRQSQTLLSA
jgi:chemotaxis signal transduction protein